MTGFSTWQSGPGIIQFADGRRVRGRGLRHGPAPTDDATDRSQFGLYLLGKEPPPTPWPSRWLRWPDFRLPSDRADAVDAFREAFERSATERVEVACGGGVGRTGTALACMAILAGTPPEQAVDYVRANYLKRAVETPWQRRYVRKFTA